MSGSRSTADANRRAHAIVATATIAMFSGWFLLGASGAIHRANLVGVAVGPPVAGWLTDRIGSYDPCWLLVTAVLGLAGVAVLVRRARKIGEARRAPAL